MADPLKNFFDRALVVRLGDSVRQVWPAFPGDAFVQRASRGLGDLELMARAGQIARALADALPADRARALALLIRSLGPQRDGTEGQGMDGFFYLPHVLFVATEGLNDFDAAMEAQYQLTRRFTAEWSLRPFLERHPGPTLERLRGWARDPNAHVRRLVSEGTRSRLPWAPRLRVFEQDPSPVVALLELLKDDPDAYVQRSVANNLNDLGKDHPALLLEICRRWGQGATDARRWIIRHALRARIKAGDRAALALLGFRGAAGWSASGQLRPSRVRIGQRATVIVAVRNGSTRRASACVDLAVHFVKASGSSRAKVFKGQELTLDAGASAQLRKTISFAVHTTRTPRPGVHRVDALINGTAIPIGTIAVVAPRQ